MFLHIFYGSYFPYQGQKGTWSSKTNRKDNQFKYNFHIICRYLNLVKNQEDNFLANKNSQVVTTLKIYRLGEEKYMLFSLNFA
jgi:hypothetical protein